jgi:hydroxyacylglutathione hydrolase
MKIDQLYTKCLAEAAYYIESNGEAVIIDPLRETAPYLEILQERGTKLKYILETHFHADFVSGHIDLAKQTGATVVFGPNAETSYETHQAKDGEVLKVGNITIDVMHTPGHTLESTTYLLRDEDGKEKAIFTGDTLFIGDVGRPDLAIKSDLTQEDLAGMLYDSLRNKIMTLPDDVIVYPAHGAGSSCGKNMSKETFDTLGNQKQVNYALEASLTKEAFIKELTTGILPAPQYFAKNAMLNKQGYDAIDGVLAKGNTALDLVAFKAKMNDGALVLDVRGPQEFCQSFVPKALNIGLDGTFAVWVGSIIEDLKTPILLVVPEGREHETVMRLARVGYDNVVGYLAGGYETWTSNNEPTDAIRSISPQTFENELPVNNYTVLDVRKPGEFEAEHLEVATNQPLDFITAQKDSLDKSKPYYVHCAGGYRSMIFASYMKQNGFDQLIDVAGGYGKIKETGLAKTAFVCPSTLT